MNFQENLRIYREKAGFTSAQKFAEYLQIPYTTYVGYENKGREPKYAVLCRIASALGVTTDQLLGFKPNEFAECVRLVRSAGLFDIDYDDQRVAITITGSYGNITSSTDLLEHIFILPRERFVELINRVKASFDKSISIQEQWGNCLYIHITAAALEAEASNKPPREVPQETKDEINRLLDKAARLKNKPYVVSI